MYSQWVIENMVGEVTRLRLGNTTVGREPDNAVHLTSIECSRNHAVFKVVSDGSSLCIEDKGSLNGVFVNSKLYRNQHVELSDGDRVGIGVWADEEDDVDWDNYPMFTIQKKPLKKPGKNSKDQPAVTAQSPSQTRVKKVYSNLKVVAQVDLSDSEDESKSKDTGGTKGVLETIDEIFGVDESLMERLADVSVVENNVIILDEDEELQSAQGKPEVSPEVPPEVTPEVDIDDDDDESFLFSQSIMNEFKSEFIDLDFEDRPQVIESRHAVTNSPIYEIEESDDEKNANTNNLRKRSFSKSENSSESDENVVEEIPLKRHIKRRRIHTYSSDSSQEDNQANEEIPLESIQPKPTLNGLKHPAENNKLKNVTANKKLEEDKKSRHRSSSKEAVTSKSEKSSSSKSATKRVSSTNREHERKKKPRRSSSRSHSPLDIEEEKTTRKSSSTKNSTISRHRSSRENENKTSSNAVSERSLSRRPSTSSRTSTRRRQSTSERDQNVAERDNSTTRRPSTSCQSSTLRRKSTSERDQNVAAKDSSSSRGPSTSCQPSTLRRKSISERDQNVTEKVSFSSRRPSTSCQPSTLRSKSTSERGHVETPANSSSSPCRPSTSHGSPVQRESDAKKSSPEASGTVALSVSKSHQLPQIIEPPTMPVNKGKLRGFSACIQRPQPLDKILQELRCKDKQSAQIEQLKSKWHTSPADAIKKRRESLSACNEERKQKLKELAERERCEHPQQNVSTKVLQVSTAKVKVTKSNRGAFLTKEAEKPLQKYTIPKSRPAAAKETAGAAPVAVCPPCPRSTLGSENRPAPPREPPKGKLSFKAVERLNEKPLLFRKSSPIKLPSKLVATHNVAKRLNSSLLTAEKKLERTEKKQVRFKDQPEVHIFETEVDPPRLRKVVGKDLVKDCSDELIRELLTWKASWLDENNEEQVKRPQAVFPMMHRFADFKAYKNTLFPLMKVELYSIMEKKIKMMIGRPTALRLVSFQVDECDCPEFITYKCHSSADLRHRIFDVVLVELKDKNRSKKLIGIVRNVATHSRSPTEVIIETAYDSYIPQTLQKRNSSEISIQTILNDIRVDLGSFNSVMNVENSPLFKAILNPTNLLKAKPLTTDRIEYKGIDELNDNQKDILLRTYARSIDASASISLIEGPPGTGKSRLIANLVAQIVNTTQLTVLICAQSNAAVDVIAMKILGIRSKIKNIKMVRYGMPERVHPQVTDYTLTRLIATQYRRHLAKHQPYLEPEKKFLKKKIDSIVAGGKFVGTNDENELHKLRTKLAELERIFEVPAEYEAQNIRPFIQHANVILSTLSSCVKLSNYIKRFDICIVDEATQTTEPFTLLPLKFGINSMVLVGDTQQLPATVISQDAIKLGYNTSLFTRIQNCLSMESKSPTMTLTTQYRMDPEICRWPNQYFYKNALINGPNTYEYKALSPIKPFSILSLDFEQTGRGGNISNKSEADLVVQIIKSLIQKNAKSFESYGVITPYATQRHILTSRLESENLKHITVNTIESYQGMEKDVIIISNTRTVGVGFLNNAQRLNVALTRAKKCLILCGNFSSVEKLPVWDALLRNARQRGVFHQISAKDAMVSANVMKLLMK